MKNLQKRKGQKQVETKIEPSSRKVQKLSEAEEKEERLNEEIERTEIIVFTDYM